MIKNITIIFITLLIVTLTLISLYSFPTKVDTDIILKYKEASIVNAGKEFMLIIVLIAT